MYNVQVNDLGPLREAQDRRPTMILSCQPLPLILQSLNITLILESAASNRCRGSYYPFIWGGEPIYGVGGSPKASSGPVLAPGRG